MAKRLLCVIIIILISVVLLTICAIADNNTDGSEEVTTSTVASIDGVEYETLEEAITAAGEASSDVTITMLSSVELDSYLTIPASSYTITLDLNGCTISQSEDFADDQIIYVSGILTIMDSGENGSIVANNSNSNWTIYLYSSDAVLNIESGVIKNEAYTSGYYYSAIMVKRGTVNMYGGTLESTYGIYLNSFSISSTGLCTANIYGGTISASLMGIEVYYGSVLNVYGGTITTDGTRTTGYGVRVQQGTVNISGDDTVIGSVENTTYGVYITAQGAVELKVTGGFISGSSYGIYITPYPSSLSSANVTVSGGYIVGKNYSAVYIKESSYGTISLSIDGGYYSSDVTEYCISGYACEEISETNNCSYQVVEATSENAVVSVTSSDGEITYSSTLAAAVSGASDGDVLTLLEDVTASEEIDIEKSLELDLAGYSISGEVKSSNIFYVNGSGVRLTISDSSESGTGSITNTSTSSYSSAICLSYFASIIVKSGTISGYQALNLTGYSSANIDGGTISSTKYTGIYAGSGSSVTVSGGTVYGNVYGIYQYSNSYTKTIILNAGEVSGGTSGMYITSVLTVPEDSTVKVSGTSSALAVELYDSTTDTVSIAGGYFSSALEEDWCAEGYIPTEEITEGDYAGYYSAMKGIYLGISSDTESTTKIPATIEYGEDEATMYVLVSGEYIGTDGYYSTDAYPVTSLAYEDSGYIFAGWYSLSEDGTDYEAMTAFPTGADACAKFVDENVLTTGAQISAGTESTDETTDMRFVSTVDVLDYSLVGFDITIGDKTVTVKTTTVYSSILGTDGEIDYTYSPQSFSSASNYFDVYTLLKIPASVFDSEISVKAYWVTLDGTTVYGEDNTFIISDMISES